MDASPRAVTPLRQRMIDDMRRCKLAEKTQIQYLRAVRRLGAFLGRSPDTATVEDLRRYQLHLVDHGTSPISINAAITGLKFFFEVTLDRSDLIAKMRPVRVPRKLPVVLSREEVARLITAAGNLKHQTARSAAYGAGLRASEVVALKVTDIDSGRMILRTIAADPQHLGARVGVTLVLHTWGSALTHPPHVHGIVPGGGLAAAGDRWVACRPGFFLPVRVLSRLFRRRFLDELTMAHRTGWLPFFGADAGLSDPHVFARWLAPLREVEWVVNAKRPFAGPAAVLTYLSRYTHRVAISNQRLLALDERGVTFRWKDYRATGKTRHKAMTLATDEFIHRFLLHVLPSGFHRIRHNGLLANAGRRAHLALARELLHAVPAVVEPSSSVAAPVAIAPPTLRAAA